MKRWIVMAALSVVVLRAQTTSSIDADLARIFQQNDFAGERFGPASWTEKGEYTLLAPSAAVPGAQDIVRFEAASGSRSVLVSADGGPPHSAGSITVAADLPVTLVCSQPLLRCSRR